jgi:quinol monooxygenase YgiN
MSAPFVYVGTMSVKPGKLEAIRGWLTELVDFVETNEPRIIAFHAFLHEEGERLVIVQVHPDPASMEFHMESNARHFATAFDYLDAVVSEQYYGEISDSLAVELAKWDDPAIAVTRLPIHAGGFTRTTVRSTPSPVR